MTILEETSSLNINYFTRLRAPNGIILGRFSWHWPRMGCDYVTFCVNYNANYIRLTYNYQGKRIDRIIKIVKRPSNLGKGGYWLFVCPVSGRLCRKFYFICGQFVHRAAFNDVYYEDQGLTKRRRPIRREIRDILSSNATHDEMQKRNYRISYAGKLTKRWVKYLRYLHKYNVGDTLFNAITPAKL